MSATTPDVHGSEDPIDSLAFDETTAKRATHESFSLVPGRGAVAVTNDSYGADSDAHTYVVTLADGVPVSCTCPAFEHHCDGDEACKHQVRVALSPAVIDVATVGGEQR